MISTDKQRMLRWLRCAQQDVAAVRQLLIEENLETEYNNLRIISDTLHTVERTISNVEPVRHNPRKA